MTRDIFFGVDVDDDDVDHHDAFHSNILQTPCL
jgi:hypothetical protein